MSDRSYSPRREGHSYSTRSSSPHSWYSHSRSRSHSRCSYRRSPSPDYYRERSYYYSSRSPSSRYRSRSPRYEGRPDCTVFIGNLPYETSWYQLKDFMRDAGHVVHADIVKCNNGRSKGCGIVEYRYPEDAKRAIHMLNDVRFMGRYVYVRYHRIGGRSERDVDTPKETPEDYSETRRSNGTGIVIFDDPSDARCAISKLNGYRLQGNTIEVMEERYRNMEKESSAPTTTVGTVVLDTIKPPPPVLDSNYHHPSPITNNETPTHHQPIHRYLDPVPPPPPMYPAPTLVGGPAADLPTHGHNQIYVNNLPFSTTWQDLIDLFRHVGPVIRSEIILVNGHPKGAGYVRFEDADTCQKAIERFNGYMYGGRPLDIKLDKYSTTV
ncbi:hypothetical protein G6F57_005189 [Rhizopus arrhizus]|uniref:RRM domain-containing protein n=1 Tax=Rhizopus oryzae TaxID=64495 RepID=A0A9P6XBN0_RHIOR|nr:hypothetical protein G6F23_001618 [Rhizopus arrhizus]KAG0765007.1 hypothetical protein G6F24_004771 [Rhizopus arrhizus]KAG0776976.1 hypothetical protein G6F22_012191 [Rhizopus arrhizus]KAG0786163.1 hypothetical protein G6F21_008787 [Rhizopus arrhizus]KAG0812811.1 hypothetical protein G6F20_006056 [Rhizopus arrhizus]